MYKFLEEQNKSKKISDEKGGFHKKEGVKNSPHPLFKMFKIKAYCRKCVA